MVDLIIVITRYLFIFYMFYFLWQGVVYILDERNIHVPSFLSSTQDIAINKQMFSIIFMHISGFLILSYDKNSPIFVNIETLITGGLGLLFLIISMIAVNKVFKDSCLLMFNGVYFLMDIGLIMLQRINPAIAKRQLMWFSISVFLMLLIPLFLRVIPKFEKLEKVYLIIAILFLISPFAFGLRTNGAVNWISIKGITFQPSEVVKFLYIFYLASIFRKKISRKLLILPIISSGFIVLVLVVQRDLGGALIFFMTFLVLLYIVTGSYILFLGGMLSASLGAVLAYKLFSHIRVRVIAWKDPLSVIDSGGYQIMQSLFAIGTGGMVGMGLTRGHPTVIPVVESDFLFAAICEEFGVIFAIGVILVFAMIIYRGVHIALRCKRKFYCLLAAGFTTMLAFQSFLILGGVTKLIPLTGVTLPFVSYGGSSVLVSVLMIGIMEWIYIYNHKMEED